MTQASITTKGQVTISKEICNYLKLKAGSKVDFVIDEDEKIKILPLNVPVEVLPGILHRSGMQAATIEEMEKRFWREQAS